MRNDTLVCYCFGYSRDDIRRDYLQHGQSLIWAKIVADKKNGNCACAEKNPKGR